MLGQNPPKKSFESSAAKSNGADKRYLPRWEVKNRIYYKLENEDKFQEGLSKDLSCSGACLLTKKSLPKNQKVKLTICLENEQKVEVNGEVLWNKAFEGDNLVGIAFYNTSQKAQELILKHAFELKKTDVIKHWFKGWNK